MNLIKFPGLGIEFNVSKTAFSIMGIEIYWYAVLIVFAILIGIVIAKLKDKQFNINFLDIIDLLIFLIPISIICARLYYVIFKLDYYLKYPKQIFNLRNGGLAIYGGIIGGIITSFVFCKKRKIIFWDLLDYIAPSLAIRTINWKMGKFYKCRSIWNLH